MGVLDKLRQIFKRSASMRSDATAMQSDAASMEAHGSEASPISIEKDSLQLGIAAGFTGRSLRNIEDSLTRIESQMVTKDWATLNLKADLENIQNSLDSILSSASGLPETVRRGIVSEVDRIRTTLQPTSRMLDIISIAREVKEISYEDLAKRLGIEISSLRGLLSMMGRRISAIERFERGNKGWIKYKEPITAMQSDANREQTLDESQK